MDRVGARSIRTIFAGGSVATGNVAAIEVDGVLEILSDIDLYIVVNDDVNEAEVRRMARGAVDDVVAEPGVHYAREHDVGVYTRDELLAQPLRPGTVHLARQHVLLYGDNDVFNGMGEMDSTQIPVVEGLYLIENRLREQFVMRGTFEDDRNVRLRRFHALKICLDAATAELVGAGKYSPLLEVRLERLRGLAGEGLVPGDAMDVYSEAWVAWRDLGSHLLGTGEVVLCEKAATVAALGAWKRIASRILSPSDARWSSLVDRRCHFGDYVYNFRQFLIVCKRQGLRRRDVAWSGIHLARYAPLDALRIAALADYAGELANENGTAPLVAYLDGLTSLCGFVEGGVVDRAVAMSQAVG